jgi:hypothetical protein
VNWTPTATGHEVTLLDGKVVARNKAGRQLKNLPPALRDDPAVTGLRQLTEWLTRHESACVAEVDTWMVRSLPVPLRLLVEVWPDPSWRRALTDLVVRPAPGAGDTGLDPGLLREVDPERGAGVVTLDGDTVWLPVEALAIPHPVLLDDLDDLRGFAADLGVEQVVQQLFRQTWTRPAGTDPAATAVHDWAGGRFKQATHVIGRAISQGYTVRGGSATVRIFEDLHTVEARFWVGDDPYGEAETGELQWVDERSRVVPLGGIGPVAWSEGARMAARIHAGRLTEEDRG